VERIAQRLTAEFIGTLALIFIGAGSVVMLRYGGLIGVALAHGLVLAVMVSVLGHISGGHFNPAVTISAWVTNQIKTAAAAVYIIVQLAGGAAGAGLLRVALPKSLWDQGGLHLGTPAVAHGLGHGVGIDVHEAPRLSRESNDTLAAGNVVTVEPGIYLGGLGGIRIEDLVAVTDGEPEILTSFTKELVTVN